MDPPFPCACCGCLVFPEPPGSFNICEVCNWEDDAAELEWPTTVRGANGRTLVESQRVFREGLRLGRRPDYPSLPRDPLWRPVDPDRDAFEDCDSPDPVRAPDDPVELYYWRPTFWRLNRPGESREPNEPTEDERVR
jgi:Cysteine-rich CPCC